MKNKKGFTLFELLVSISIIAILTAMAIVSFSSAQKKARDAKRVQDIQALSKAAEMYYQSENSTYPSSGNGPWTTSSGQTILDVVPTDPKGTYNLSFPNPGTSYCFCADVEGRTGNSLNNACSFVGVGGSGSSYCVKNQQ